MCALVKCSRAPSIVPAPGTLGLFAGNVLRLRRAESFSEASPSSAAKLSDHRRQLFMGPPVTRTATKKMDRQPTASTSSQDPSPSLDQDVLPPNNLVFEDDLQQESQDAMPRRNVARENQQKQHRQRESRLGRRSHTIDPRNCDDEARSGNPPAATSEAGYCTRRPKLQLELTQTAT